MTYPRRENSQSHLHKAPMDLICNHNHLEGNKVVYSLMTELECLRTSKSAAYKYNSILKLPLNPKVNYLDPRNFQTVILLHNLSLD